MFAGLADRQVNKFVDKICITTCMYWSISYQSPMVHCQNYSCMKNRSNRKRMKENNTTIELLLIIDTDTPLSVLSPSSFFNTYAPLTCDWRPFHCSLPLPNLYLASARSHGEEKEDLPSLSPGTKAEMTKNAWEAREVKKEPASLAHSLNHS